jgi:dTDP-glucose 4,6-dehydratase
MKQWLVTGGAGFIGSNFVRSTVARGDVAVTTLDALTYAGNVANLDGLDATGRHRFVQGDIRDRDTLRGLLTATRFDALVHFAAESHVDRSIDGPDVFVDTNVRGTLCLLNAVRQHSPGTRFLHVSTDEVFGSLGPEGHFHEASRVMPNSPYSASKAASDHLVRAFHHTYGLDAVTTNCSNNYGPYQFPEKLMPLMIRNALAGRPLPVYGKGDNRRDWIFVEDHCEGIRLAIERGKAGEVYLLGGRAERSNLELVHLLCEALERQAPARNHASLGGKGYADLITFVEDRPGHDFRYAIDPSRAERDLGFQVRTALPQGLDQTVAWYINNREWLEAIAARVYGGERLGKTNHVSAAEANPGART